jgi:acylphosphatase
MAGKQVARRATVHGRVQGVWYRASTAERAQDLGLRGHARNLEDGTVEVLAIGPAPAVDELLEWLWQGPPLAKVTRVEVQEIDADAVAAAAGNFSTR